LKGRFESEGKDICSGEIALSNFYSTERIGIMENDRIKIGDLVTIYPRGKRNLWCADFWRDGKHCRQSLRTPNRKIAQKRALQIEAALASGNFQQTPKDMKIADAAVAYLDHLTIEDRSKKTLVRYRGILNVFADFAAGLGVRCLHQFTPIHLDRYRAVRIVDHAPSTVCDEATIIKQLFRWCRTRKLLRENPVAEYKLSKPKRIPKEGPSLAEINAILLAAQRFIRTHLAVLAFTGMRSGELMRLRKEDVDFEGNWIHIVSRRGGKTKSKVSRKVPMHARLRAILEAHPQQPGPWFFAAERSNRYPKGDHHINPKKLNERFATLLKKVKLRSGREQGYTIHSLRRSFETIAVNAGIPQRVIDTWMGHQSDKSMAAVYYRLRDEDSQRFMKKMPFGEGPPAKGENHTEDER
jgi:integrase